MITLLVLIMAILVTFKFFKSENKAKETHIELWNDLRSELVPFEIKINDSLLIKSPVPQDQKKSIEIFLKKGTHDLKTTINGLTTDQKFSISEAVEKYIYIRFDDSISDFRDYYSTIKEKKLQQKIGTRKYTREEFRRMVIETENSIKMQDLKTAGYISERERFKIVILNGGYKKN